jgi:DNA topoisomerase-1
MSYTLLIVESPAKCQKIEKFLGSKYKVLGSFGHITHLSNLNQIDISNNFNPCYQIIDSKQQHINKLKKSIQNAKEIILATDDDREGEAIAWHIATIFKLDIKNTKRIIFHEITETAIKNALQNPTTINMDLVYSQQGRQILDLLVGFKISPILWKYIVSNTKNSLSAGRCQTPALRLVYENYKDIINSPGKQSFNTSGYFTSKNIEFKLNFNYDDTDSIINFMNLSKTFKYILKKDNEKDIIKTPPIPFITSSLQQSANNNMHISPKETMSLAQKLYESGYITYMRTDSKLYSKEFIDNTKKYIINNYNEYYINKNIDNFSLNNNKQDISDKNNNLTQDAHEAIRPTNININILPDNDEKFTAKHKKLYKLIWNNTIESLMSDSIYKQLNLKIVAPQDKYYKYSSEENIFPGYKIIEGIEEDKYFKFLKNLKEGNIVPNKIISKETLKELKSHYNEACLVQLLEKKGIGRPSTYSSLIDKIQEREYVKKENVEGRKIDTNNYILEDFKNKDENKLENMNLKIEKETKEFGNEKNKLVITQTGIFVIEFLLKHFEELFNYEYTKTMENALDLIANGENKYYTLCNECNISINKLIDKINKANSKSKDDSNIDKKTKYKLNIKIDNKHTYLIGKNGPTIKYLKEDGSMGFYGVKKNVDIEKLKNNEYKLNDIIELKEDNIKLLGKYKDEDVYLKKGKFGYYLECGKILKSIQTIKINVPLKNIELNDAISILQDIDEGNNSLQRRINENISIRKGKYGDYIFYKTDKMYKPKFYKLHGFKDDYKNCEIDKLYNWIKETFDIK